MFLLYFERSVTVPLSPRLSPAAVQCDVMRRVTEAETQLIQHHAHEADLQAHMSSLHPGMDAPSANCNQFQVSETDTGTQHLIYLNVVRCLYICNQCPRPRLSRMTS